MNTLPIFSPGEEFSHNNKKWRITETNQKNFTAQEIIPQRRGRRREPETCEFRWMHVVKKMRDYPEPSEDQPLGKLKRHLRGEAQDTEEEDDEGTSSKFQIYEVRENEISIITQEADEIWNDVDELLKEKFEETNLNEPQKAVILEYISGKTREKIGDELKEQNAKIKASNVKCAEPTTLTLIEGDKTHQDAKTILVLGSGSFGSVKLKCKKTEAGEIFIFAERTCKINQCPNEEGEEKVWNTSMANGNEVVGLCDPDNILQKAIEHRFSTEGEVPETQTLMAPTGTNLEKCKLNPGQALVIFIQYLYSVLTVFLRFAAFNADGVENQCISYEAQLVFIDNAILEQPFSPRINLEFEGKDGEGDAGITRPMQPGSCISSGHYTKEHISMLMKGLENQGFDVSYSRDNGVFINKVKHGDEPILLFLQKVVNTCDGVGGGLLETIKMTKEFIEQPENLDIEKDFGKVQFLSERFAMEDDHAMDVIKKMGEYFGIPMEYIEKGVYEIRHFQEKTILKKITSFGEKEEKRRRGLILYASGAVTNNTEQQMEQQFANMVVGYNMHPENYNTLKVDDGLLLKLKGNDHHEIYFYNGKPDSENKISLTKEIKIFVPSFSKKVFELSEYTNVKEMIDENAVRTQRESEKVIRALAAKARRRYSKEEFGHFDLISWADINDEDRKKFYDVPAISKSGAIAKSSFLTSIDWIKRNLEPQQQNEQDAQDAEQEAEEVEEEVAEQVEEEMEEEIEEEEEDEGPIEIEETDLSEESESERETESAKEEEEEEEDENDE